MMFLPKIFAGKDEPAENLPPSFRSNAEHTSAHHTHDKSTVVSNVESEHSDDDDHQKGVEQVEAEVKVWSPFHIYLAWAL